MSNASETPTEGDKPTDRRNFLLKSSAAVGTGLIATTVARSAEADEMEALNPKQLKQVEVWNAHTAAEFESKDADAAIETMTDNPVLIHVPVGTGASGREALRKFYAEIFIPQMPSDFELQLLSRTVGQDRIIDEFIVEFTHTVRMDWFAPGVEATDRRLRVPHVGIIAFQDEKIASEHIYWDNATVLAQLGLVTDTLPVLDSDQADRLLDPDAVANRLIERL